MTVAVRVIAKAFDDAGPGGRIRRLGEAAGYNEFEALGRLTFLWRHCRRSRTQLLDPGTIRGFLGPEGDRHLLSADLGELQDDGIRVRGLREVLETIELRSESGRVGGVASGRVRSVADDIPPDPDEANPKQTPSKPEANASSLLHDVSSSDLFPEISSLSASSESPGDLKQQGRGQRRKPRKPETECPEDFTPDDWHRAFCVENRLNLPAERDRFVDHHRGKGTLWREWPLAFRNWLRNQVAWRKAGSVPPAPERKKPLT